MSNFATYPSLKDRSVFISGGSTGIGAALVKAFSAQGAKVAFCDVDVVGAEKTVHEIKQADHRAPFFLECDLRNIHRLQEVIVEAGKVNGSITGLVNNAARDDRHAMETVTPEYWDERMAVNLKHQFFAAQAVFPMMKQAGHGSVVNFGSVSWMIGQGGMPAYTTAKSAVMGLTRSLARDMGPFNIRVNSIAPGWIMTERQLALWMTPEGEAELMKRQCLKRRLDPMEMARIVLFLLADDSSAMTNQTYVCDGGWV